MLPPLSIASMSILDYLADKAPDGAPVEVGAILIPHAHASSQSGILSPRHMRRQLPTLEAYGLITCGVGRKKSTVVRLAPLGLALIESFYSADHAHQAAEAAK